MPRKKPENGASSTEVMAAEAFLDESRKDRDFYFRNAIKIKPKGGRQIIPLEMRPAQRELMDLIDRVSAEGKAPRIIILKARQMGFCLDPSTPVLTADLRWVPLADVRPGDVLFGIDESCAGGKGTSRKMRRSVVEAVRHVFQPATRIVTDRGDLIVTPEHRLLQQVRGAVHYSWSEAKSMRVGDRLRFLVAPWPASSFEDGWFGGIIDGEGHLRWRESAGGAELCVNQNPGPVLDRAHRYLNDRGLVCHRASGGGSGLGRGVCEKISMFRTDEILRVLGMCRPTRYVNKPWWEGMSLPGKRCGAKMATILSIEPLESRPMIDLQTSTKTFIANGIVSHNSTIMCAETFRRIHLWPHQQALMVAHKTDLTETLFKSLHLMHSELPKSIQPDKKSSTKRVIHLAENNSSVQVEVAGESRGYSAQIVHISELAFVEEASTLMTAIVAAVSKDPNSIIVIESTPNGIGNEFHKIWLRAQSGRSEWIPFFVPWFKDPTYVRAPWFTLDELNLRTDEPGQRAAEIVRLHGVSLEQIAWWLYTLENDYFGDLDRMDQEMATDPSSCFLASGSKVFDRDGLKHYFNLSGYDPERHETPDERQRRELADDHSHEIDLVSDDHKHPRIDKQRGGKLWIIRPAKPRHKYLFAWDISAGDRDSDPCPGVCLDRHTLSVDAIWDGKAPPEVLAATAERCGYLYNTAKIIGEANNHGILFHHVLYNELQYPNLHWRQTSIGSTSGKVTDKLGWWTHGENREHLFNLLRRAVREKVITVEYERMVLEWSELQRDDSGRVDHPDGGTSDLSIALAMCLAVHSGGYENALLPLEADEQQRVSDIYAKIRQARSSGHSTVDLEAEIDVTGMTLDEADKLSDMLERGKRRRVRLGLGGEN